MFEKFKQYYEQRHEYARKLKKEKGKKIIGYFCTYSPEEILYAADIIPIRILGGHEPQSVGIAEPYLFGMYCPFCRDVLAQGLQGKYDYLDGIIIGQSCLHIRQSFFTWKQRILPDGFNHFIPVPCNLTNRRTAVKFLRKELEKFKEKLEKWSGKKITDDDLLRGIEIVDNNRRLMKKVYQFRKEDDPKVTGLEAMYMVASSQMVDKIEHSKEVEKLLNSGLADRELDREDMIRLMTVGSENDDIEFTKMVESLDSTIVIEDHCTGSRYFWDETNLDGKDPLTAIAERYVDRTPCPSKDWFPGRKRFERVLEFIDDFNVEGVLLIQQKFCDPHETDIPALRDLLNEKGIKNYFLEFDITVPIGQFRIRVEAFLETFNIEDDLF